MAESAPATELIVALGREGKRRVGIDAGKLPRTAAMAAKLDSPEGRSRYRRRKAIVEPYFPHIADVISGNFRGPISRGSRLPARRANRAPDAAAE